jgi:hypothetical protein
VPTIDLPADELAAVAAAIRGLIEGDRYPHAPRLDPLRAALARLEAASEPKAAPAAKGYKRRTRDGLGCNAAGRGAVDDHRCGEGLFAAGRDRQGRVHHSGARGDRQSEDHRRSRGSWSPGGGGLRARVTDKCLDIHAHLFIRNGCSARAAIGRWRPAIRSIASRPVTWAPTSSRPAPDAARRNGHGFTSGERRSRASGAAGQ